MDAQRRLASRLRAGIKLVVDYLGARTPDRRKRLAHEEALAQTRGLDLEQLLEERCGAVAEPGALADVKKDLLALADAIVRLAQHAAEEGPGSDGWRVPPGADPFEHAAQWIYQLSTAAAAAHALLRHAVGACSASEAEEARLLSVVAIAVGTPGTAAALLDIYQQPALVAEALMRPGHIEVEHRISGVDEWVGLQLRVMRSALSACCERFLHDEGLDAPAPVAAAMMAGALSPDALMAWLAELAAALLDIRRLHGLDKSMCGEELPRMLNHIGCFSLHLAALASDAGLLRMLGKLTTALHATLYAPGSPGWCGEPQPGATWNGTLSELSAWVQLWHNLPWPEDEEARRRCMLPLLRSAQSMLALQVQQLAALPSLPPDPTNEDQAARWLDAWDASINLCGGCVRMLASAADLYRVQGLDLRMWQAFQLTADVAPHFVRLAAALADWPAGGHPFVDEADTFPRLLRDWASLCKQASEACDGGTGDGEPSPAEQAQQAEAALRMCTSAAQVLALLPRLGQLDGLLLGEALVLTLLQPWRRIDCMGPHRSGLARLQVDVCRVTHALLAPSQQGAESARPMRDVTLTAVAATYLCRHLTVAVSVVSWLLLDASQQGRPTAAEAALQPDRARRWDRRCACAILSAATALAAVVPHNGTTGRPADVHAEVDPEWDWAAPERARMVQALVAVMCREESASGEAAMLDFLPLWQINLQRSGCLRELLLRLLPPPEPDAQQQQAAADKPWERAELSLEAALFEAHALGTRKCCANLRCPHINMPAGQDAGGSRGEGGSSTRREGKKCGGCLTVRFCSRACAKAAWPAHRTACRALAAGQGTE